MATSNNRNVTLELAIEASGEDQVKTLAGSVRALAKEGGPAAAEYQRLADELDRVGAQNAAARNLAALREETERLAAAESAAANAAGAAAARHEEFAASLADLKAKQLASREETAQAKSAYHDLNSNLRTLKASGAAAGESQDVFKERVRQAALAVVDQNRALKEREAQLRAANISVSEAAQAEAKLAARVRETATAYERTQGALETQARTLAASEQQTSRLGVATLDLAGAQEQLSAALSESLSANVRALENSKDQAESDRLLAIQADALAEARKRGAAALAAEERAQSDAVVAVRAYERAQREAAAAAVAAAEASAKRVAAQREQSAADVDAARTAQALSAARQRGIQDLAAERAALADSTEFVKKYEQAQREAAAAVEREGVAAMQALERAAAQADAEMAAFAATLKGTQSAMAEYAAATEAAMVAGEGDAAAMQARVTAANKLLETDARLTAEQRALALATDASRAATMAEAQAVRASERAKADSLAATQALITQAVSLGTTMGVTGRQAQALGSDLNNAFGTVGIRSMEAIEAEIAKVERALSRLEAANTRGALSAQELARAQGAAAVSLNRLQQEAQQIQSLPGTFERISGSVQGLLARFGALGAAVASIGVAVKPVLDATIALDQMRRTLTTVTGSAESAAEQISYLRRVSQQSGQSFDESGKAYAKFAASALQAGLNVREVQAVFSSVSLAAGNLGLSSDQAGRALEALSQIASKGTVGMEELRQQLGDALPGVLPLLAKELGLTNAELNKVVESGGLLASEAIPAVGRALLALQAANGESVTGIVAEWNRFINVMKLAGTSLVEGPLGTVAGFVLESLAGVIRDVTVAGVYLNETFRVSADVLGLSAAAVAGAIDSFESFGGAVDEILGGGRARMTEYLDVAYGVDDANAKLAKTITNALGPSFARLALDQQKAVDAASLLVQSAEKSFQAKKTEAEATVTLAAALGDEVVAREAATVAAETTAQAAAALNAVQAREVEVLEGQRAALEAAAGAQSKSKDEIKAATAALTEKITKARGDLEKTDAQAASTRAHAEAMKLAALQYGDNSAKIDQYRAAVAEAEKALIGVQQAAAADSATTQDVEKTTRALAQAKGLLRDAVNDLDIALKAQVESMRADVALSEAQIKLDIAKAKNAAELAKARGDEAAARTELARVATLEQEATQRTLDLKQREAELTVASLTRQREELASIRELTAEESRSFDTKIKLAQAAKLEAEAGQEGNRIKAAEVTALAQANGIRQQYTGQVQASAEAHGAEAKTVAATGEATTNATAAVKTYRGEVNGVAVEVKAATEAHDASEKALASNAREFNTAAVAAKTYQGEVNGVAVKVKATTSEIDDNVKALARQKAAVAAAQAGAKLLNITLQQQATAGITEVVAEYERLKGRASSTSTDIKNAFVSAATKAIEAAGGIIPEWVKIEAATRGATVSVDNYGKVTIDVMKRAVLTVNDVAAAMDAAGTKAKNLAFDTEKAAAAAKSAADGGQLSQIATDYVNSPAYQLGQKKAAGTLSAEDSTAAAGVAGAAAFNWQMAQDNGTQWSTGGYRDAMRLYNEARFIQEQASGPSLRGKLVSTAPKSAAGASLYGTAPAARATPSSASTSHTVTINVNGSPTTVNTASAADASALSALLASLGNAQSVT